MNPLLSSKDEASLETFPKKIKKLQIARKVA
jgi:hypothetical protein